MYIEFRFRLYKGYLPVAVNKETKEWRCGYETLHKRVAEEKVKNMRLRYKTEDGWEVSIQKEVILELGGLEKTWTTEFFGMPEGWKPGPVPSRL